MHDLVEARRAGAIDRDTYWARMREHHRELAAYAELVAASGVEAIEVTAEGARVRLPSGVAFAFDPADVRCPPVVLLNDGAYERAEWAIIKSLGFEARTVVDVGAHIGWYAIQLGALRRGRPGIHAFEPVPATFGLLAGNIELNALSFEIQAHPVGLGDLDGEVQFYLPKLTGSVGASQRPLFANEPHQIVHAAVRRLDDIAAEVKMSDIDFIKCDVEGGEYAFLLGATATIERWKPVVLTEMLRKWAAAFGYHPNDIVTWMRSRGYSCQAISADGLRSIERIDDETRETNYLFVHIDRAANVRDRLRANGIHDANQ
jgi:FkbM family methyltransferase